MVSTMFEFIDNYDEDVRNLRRTSSSNNNSSNNSCASSGSSNNNNNNNNNSKSINGNIYDNINVSSHTFLASIAAGGGSLKEPLSPCVRELLLNTFPLCASNFQNRRHPWEAEIIQMVEKIVYELQLKFEWVVTSLGDSIIN